MQGRGARAWWRMPRAGSSCKGLRPEGAGNGLSDMARCRKLACTDEQLQKVEKRARVERDEWAKRVARWRTLTYWHGRLNARRSARSALLHQRACDFDECTRGAHFGVGAFRLDAVSRVVVGEAAKGLQVSQ
jgi:hypothetical protein